MDLPWGSDPARKFVTNVGLITSDGPYGPNVMACEWTHHIAYEPGMILISVGVDSTTAANIRGTKEFGVALASEKQNIVASIAGGTHGKDVNKIALLTQLGADFYAAQQINVPMISGAAMNAECRVIEMKEVGDQAFFIGEVVNASASDQAPLVYHGGKYYKVGEQIEKPPQDMLDKIKSLVAQHRR